ncbi:hypothetical protein TDB9533_04721 [Thalassocella blandensis]|nr:hypothetical protein TDB9533_04721 [Thalassocella blandensis]
MIQEAYNASLWGITVIILLVIVQWAIATAVKAKQKGAIPGKIDSSLSHDSFVFRAHRTFMNTLENIPAMLGICFLALFIGTDPTWTAALIWIFVASRAIHMALYYAIATEKNPSPRTYFFLFGFLATLGLFGLCIATLV